MLEKLKNLLEHPFVDTLAKTIKKFKSSKSYWSLSSFILLFTIREAIAWKFGDAIKTFCETQSKNSDYAWVWDVVGFFFDVGGSIELVVLGASVFVILSLVKVSESQNSSVSIKENYLSLFLILFIIAISFYQGDTIREVVNQKSEDIQTTVKQESNDIKKLIKELQIFGNKEKFLQAYFGDDWQKALQNPQTYNSLKQKLENAQYNTQKLLTERKELLEKIEATRLKSSIQKMVEKAFKELRYKDVRTLLDEFIANNQAIGDDLIKAHFQKALSYIEEVEYFKAKEEFEKYIPVGIEDAYIQNQYGVLYHTLGDYDKFLKHSEISLKLAIKEFGENHLNVATIYNNIGEAWRSKGEYDKAIEFYNRALKILIPILGKNHPNVEICKNNLERAEAKSNENLAD